MHTRIYTYIITIFIKYLAKLTSGRTVYFRPRCMGLHFIVTVARDSYLIIYYIIKGRKYMRRQTRCVPPRVEDFTFICVCVGVLCPSSLYSLYLWENFIFQIFIITSYIVALYSVASISTFYTNSRKNNSIYLLY